MSHDKDRVARLWDEYSPRIAEARKRDSARGHLSFVDFHLERIGEFPAVPLTIEKYLLSQQAGCFDGTCGKGSPVLIFLWIVNPDFEAEPEKGRAFFRKHRKTDCGKHAKAIQDYVTEAFGETTENSQSSRGLWVASIIDMIASEYGWSEKEIMQAPITRLMAYCSAIRVRHGGSAVSFGSEADRMHMKFMEEANLEEG